MYQDLLKMGFPEDLSLAAASKYPDNIEEAMDWLINKQAIDKVLKDENIDPMDQDLPHHHSQSEHKQSQQIQPHFYEEANGYHASNDDDDEDEEEDEQNYNKNNHNNHNHNSYDQHDEEDEDLAPNQDKEPMNNHHENEQNEYKQQESISINNNNISEAISTADIVIKGEFSPDTSDEAMLIITDLMNTILNENVNDKYPTHIVKPFLRWTDKIQYVKLNSMYYQQICDYLLVDHKRVKNLYAFDKINKIFPNVESIEAFHSFIF